MIVILKPGAQKARVEALMTQIKQQGVDIHYSQGTTETILGLVGDTTHVDEDWLRASDIVEDVRAFPNRINWRTVVFIPRIRTSMSAGG